MRSVPRILSALCAAALIPLTTATGALAAGVQPGVCEGPVTASTTLTEDVQCMVVVEASGVVLDLGGHTVTGGLMVDWGASGVTLRNGTVQVDGGVGVYVGGVDVLLEDLTVTGATRWGVEAGNRTTVRGSAFADNPGVAVGQYYGSDLRVEDSTFRNNGTGVSVQSGDGAVLRANQFSRNGTGVNVWDEDQSLADGTQVVQNEFVANGVGVRVQGWAGAQGTVVAGNQIRDSRASGVLVVSQGTGWGDGPGGAAGTVIRDNTVVRSGSAPVTVQGCLDPETGEFGCSLTADDGISVLAPPEVAATIQVARNRVLQNAGHGIEAVGVTDGGRNVASHNRAGACLGVTCR